MSAAVTIGVLAAPQLAPHALRLAFDDDAERNEDPAGEELPPQPGANDENELCRHHLPLADALARNVHTHIGSALSLDVLSSAARLGLFGAARRYDPARRIAFANFAKPRILGAMFDELRGEHLMKRSSSDRALELKALLNACGRATRPEELFEEESLAWLGAWRAIAGVRTLAVEGAASLSDVVRADAEGADEALERAERLFAVRTAMAALHARKRTLVERVFFEGETLGDAAASIGRSTSWGSRLLAEALMEIKRTLAHESRRERVSSPAAVGVRARLDW
jgi:RNA polymerase sigma factor FliA